MNEQDKLKMLRTISESNLQKRIINYKTFFWALVLIVLSIFFTYIFNKLQITNNNIVTALITALFTIGMIDLIYAVSLRREFQEEMSIEIYKVFQSEEKVLKKFSPKEIGNFVENNLRVRVGNAIGTILYNEAIKPYIEQDEVKEIFRESFEYKINLLSLGDDRVCSCNEHVTTFKKEDYFLITEELSFTKKVDLNVQKEKRFTVIIAFNDQQLTQYFPPSPMSKNCIYREILKLSSNEKNVCQGYFKTECVGDKKIINVRVKIDDKVLPITSAFNRTANVFEVDCHYGSFIFDNNENPRRFNIEVQSLSAKEINFYTAYIVEPSFDPKIIFRWDNGTIKEVTPVAFYTGKNIGDLRFEPSDPEVSRYIQVITKNSETFPEWVFPRSGVVFIWKVCE